MNAIILAGGFGNRLRPLTDAAPKPMLTVANVPIIDYTVSHLWNFGIRNFIFTLAYKPEQIIDFAISYSGLQCRFSIESEPLGTLGGVKAAERFLDDHFLVTSGDLIEDINLESMLHKHFSSNALVTMAVTEVSDTSGYGVPELDGWGNVVGFTEKPLKGTAKSPYANCGVYIVDKSVLSLLPADTKLDFALDLIPALIQKRKLAAFIHDGYWRDVGTFGSYYSANFELAGGGFFDPAPHRNRGNYLSMLILEDVQSLVAAAASVEGRVYRSVVSSGARILPGAEIENCIVLNGASVGGKNKNKIIGQGCAIPVDNVFLPAGTENFSGILNKNNFSS